MSKTIDERVLEMRFDNAQFERGVSQTMSSVEKLKDSLDMDGVGKGFNVMDKAISTVQAKFSALEVVGVTALANITNSAINAGKELIKAFTITPVKSGFQEYETQINAIQTILANTEKKGSTLEDVNNALDELNHYADMTIYNFTEMTRNIGTFTAAGVDLDTSVQAIKGIANLAAVSGSTSQQASTAMYQLSQALAAGTVKLQDWNSVVNAGMGGQVFQDALMETARVHGIAIDQMVADEGSFRETLQEGWLTSSILTETLAKFTGDLSEEELRAIGYTQEQIESIMKMGQTANDAATKVKTFSQLFDTLGEAVQSGWTQTWEILIGDFGEAKELFTGISDTISEMINASANARNELLSGAMTSGWSQLLGEGITDAVGFKEAIVDSALAHGVAIDELIQNTEKFEDSLNQGWLTADVMSDALENLTAKTSGLSDEELASIGYTREQADALAELNQSVKDGSVNLEEYAGKISRMSGRENLIQGFKNIWDALFAVPKEAGDLIGVITAIKEAFRDIFPATTSEQIYQLTESFKNFTEKFKMSGETAEKLKNTFKGFFAVLDIGKQALSALWKAISPLFGGLNKLSGGILSVSGSFGEWLVGIDKFIKENGIFESVIRGVQTAVSGLIRSVQSIPIVQNVMTKLQAGISDAFSSMGDYFRDGIERIKNFINYLKGLDEINLSNLGDVFGNFYDNVLKYFITLGGRFNSFGDILSALRDKGKRCFEDLHSGIRTFTNGVAAYFGGLNNKFGEFITNLIDVAEKARAKFTEHIGLGEILTIGIGAGMILVVKQIGNALDLLASPLASISKVAKNFGELLESCSDAVNAFALELKSKALVNAAKSIAILVGALVLLTRIDQNNLWSSIAALGVLAAGMVAVCAALGALDKVGDFKKVGASMSGIAAAMFVLIAAMGKLEKLDSNKLWGNMAVLGMLAVGLGTVAAIMGRVSPNLSNGAAFLLAFAASMNLLIGSMKKLETLDVSKSGRAVPLLIAVVTGMGIVAAACGNLKMGSAASILAVAVGLNILASTFIKLAGMDLSGIRNKLGVFAVILTSFAGIMAASHLAGANAAKAGVGILAMSAALLLIVPAIKGLGKLDPLDMERASDAVGKLLLVFAAVTAASRFAGANAAKAGAMLLMMSGAMVILSGVMVLLSHLKPEGLDQALKAIVKLELVFGALIAATYFAKDCKGNLTMLAVSIGLMATALGALSLINPERLQSATAALSIVMGVFSLVIASSGLAKAAKGPMTVMVATIGGLAAILTILSLLNVQSALENASALSLLMLALTGSLAVISKTGTMSTSAYASIGVMTAVVAGLAVILGVLSKLDVTSTLENAASLSILLLSLSGSCLILSKVGATGAAAFTGIGALVTLIAAVGGLMTAIGALVEYFPGVESFLNKGMDMLETIGYGLGSFVGNIIGGFTAGATAGLPEIGANLSAFMTGAKPFFDNVKDISPDSMVGVEALADAILLLSKADILNSLTSWITGGASLTTFANQLTEFGTGFKAYAEEMNGITNMDVVSASAAAAKTLAEFASAIPNSGGLIAKLTGENSLTAFAMELTLFGPAFALYAASISGITNMDVVTASAAAAKSLAEFASAVPNSGGKLAQWVGENSLKAFAEELKAFGPAFAEYAVSVANVEMDTVTASAAAAQSLAKFASAIPNSGGLLAKITGENSLSAFAQELKLFGPAFAEYATSISEVKPEIVTASAAAAQSLAALANNLPNSGGLAGLFAGNNDIGNFGTQLSSFGENFKMYCNSIGEIGDMEKVASASAALQALIDVAKGGGDIKGLKSFGSFLQGLAETKLDDFLNALDGAEPKVQKAGESLGNALETGIRSTLANFKKVGQEAGQGFANGIKSKLSVVSSAGRSLGTTAESAARKALDSHSPSRVFARIGVDLYSGFVEGILSGTGAVSAASTVMGDVSVEALRTAIGAHSNADETKDAGSDYVGGYEEGISKGTGKIVKAVTNFANASLTSLKVTDEARDAWIGKSVKAGNTEIKAAEATAKADKKSANSKVKSAKKVSTAKKESTKSAYETFVEYIEEEEFYGRIDTAEKLAQYKKVLDTYKLSAEERKKAAREVYTLEKQLRDESYQHSMNWIEKEKYFNRLSLEEELAAYERVQARYKQGTDEWLKMEKEKYRVKQELDEASYQHSMNWIEQEESFDRLGMAAKLAAYTRVQQRYAKGTDKRKQMDKEVYALQKQIWQAEKDYRADSEKAYNEYYEKRMSLEQEYADKVTSVNERLEQDIESVNDQLERDIQSLENQLQQDIQSLNDQYESSLESRINSLYKAYGLFDEVSEKEAVSGEILMKNLEDQIFEFESWQDTLDSLSSRGLSDELLSELQEMGPSSIAQIKALNEMTDEDLEKYASLWGIKHALAREQATDELAGLREDTKQQIEDLRADAEEQMEELRQNAKSEIAGLRQDAAEELDEYRAEWDRQMNELESNTAKHLEELKNTFEKTVGILPEYTEAEFTEMVTSANNILRQAGWNELGQQIVLGLSEGVMTHKAKFVSGLVDLANAGVNAVKTTLDIHSPSKVFGKLGSFAAMGFVNALSNYGNRSYEAGLSLADNAREGLAFASDAIADVLSNDYEPTVRPVLDLTNVESQAGYLDNLFTREQHLSIQNVTRTRGQSEMDSLGSLLRDSLSSGNDDIVEAITELRSDVSMLSESIRHMQVVLDSGTVAGELAPAIDLELGALANWRRRNM